MNEIHSPSAPTKASFVAQSIADSIKERKLAPGECLRTVREFADQYGVSLSVIQAALRQLEADGLVTRVGRSLVARDTEETARECGRILLCLPSRGHLFSECYALLSHELLDKKRHPILLDESYTKTEEKRLEWERRLKELVLGGSVSVASKS